MKNKVVWKTIKKYHFEYYFIKNCFKWFALMLIPCMLIGLVSTILLNVVHSRNLSQYKEYYTDYVQMKTEKIFDSMDSFHLLFSNDYNVGMYLLEGYKDNNELSIAVGNVNNLINSYVLSNEYIKSVYLYNKKSDTIIANNGAYRLNEFYDKTLVDFLKTNSNDRIFEHKLVYNGDEMEYITICKSVIVHGYAMAEMVYNIDKNKLNDILITGMDAPIIQIYDNRDTRIFVSDNSYEGYKNDKNVIIIENPYNLSTTIDFSNTTSQKTNTAYTILFFLAFICVLISDVLFSYKISKRYFIMLIENISQFEQSYYENDNKLKELDAIIDNSKKKKVKDAEGFIINQYYKIQKMQLVSLQEQINPHFIFNTLQLISLFDIEKNNEPTQISEVVGKFADIIRYAIETDSNITTIENEINYLDKYIEIQNIKYENKFEYKKNIQPDLLGKPYVKFILQPVVENAIIHGILQTKAKRGTIVVNVYIKDETLYTEIINDGAAISNDYINELNEKLENACESTQKHIGLLNVNQRIKILFGDNYGCKIESSQEKTQVTILLPANI